MQPSCKKRAELGRSDKNGPGAFSALQGLDQDEVTVMATANHPTTVARWNTRFSDDTAPLITRELEYVLDGDDPIARAARASVLIITTQAVAA